MRRNLTYRCLFNRWLRFVSAEVGNQSKSIITLTFNREPYVYCEPIYEDFKLIFSGGAVNIEYIEFYSDSATVNIYIDRDISYDETGTISYINSNRDRAIYDDSHRFLHNFHNKRIVNNISINTVYAGTSPSGKILESINGGYSFTDLGSKGYGIPTCFCRMIDGTIFYGTDEGYIIDLLNDIIYDVTEDRDVSITCIRELGLYHGYPFAGTDNGKIYSFVYDEEFHWIESTPSGISGKIYDIIGTGSTYRIYLVENGLFYYSNIFPEFNGWLITGTMNFIAGITYDLEMEIYFIADSDGHIWASSSSNGSDWEDLGVKVNNNIISMVSANNGRIIFIDNDIVYYTDNNFIDVSQLEAVGDAQKSLSYISGDILLIGQSAGVDTITGNIWRSIDNGLSWSEIEGNPQQGEESICCIV